MKRSITKADLLDCIYEVNIQDRVNPESSEYLPPSNRVLPEEQKQFDPKNLRVTVGFQNHVAKHLESLLDQSTRYKVKNVSIEKEKTNKKKKLKRDNVPLVESEIGVRLFNDSKSFLSDDQSLPEGKAEKPTRSKKTSVSDKLLLKRAKKVSVTAEYVLSKKEIKCWAPEDKGKIEILKYT